MKVGLSLTDAVDTSKMPIDVSMVGFLILMDILCTYAPR